MIKAGGKRFAPGHDDVFCSGTSTVDAPVSTLDPMVYGGFRPHGRRLRIAAAVEWVGDFSARIRSATP